MFSLYSIGLLDFLSPGDIANLCFLSKSSSACLCRNAPLSLVRHSRARVLAAAKNVLQFDHHDGDSKMLSLISQRIDKLKFYQICSLIHQYDDLKIFGFRYFCRMWLEVVRAPFLCYPARHPLIVILCSSLAPGKFWNILKDYVEKCLFLRHPDKISEMSQSAKRLVVRYYLNRGLPIFGAKILSSILWNEPFFGSIKLCAAMMDRFPESFEKGMAGHWDSVGSVLYRYEKNPGCHFPVPCEEVGCSPKCTTLGWLPRTDIYYESEVVVDEM